jgi:hypothetical protein
MNDLLANDTVFGYLCILLPLVVAFTYLHFTNKGE